MLDNIVTGLAVMIICLFLQSLLLMLSIEFYQKYQHWVVKPGFGRKLLLINAIMLLLVVGNILQVSVWASLFYYICEFTTYSDAFYHSAVNFTTLGYGDMVMSEEFRLLGPIEAINGVIMIGASTAALMTVIQKIIVAMYPKR